MSHDLDPNLGGATGESSAYRELRAIGTGTLSETFLCEGARGSGTLVVKKVFQDEFSAQNPDFVDGPLTHLASLWHPQIARILDFGWEEGKVYFVSEHIDGRPILEAFSGASLEQILGMVAQVLIGLDFLFSRNVLHLNLKPQNILVVQGPSGPSVKLLDYGWMCWMYPPTRIESNAVGSPPYTAPEYAMRRALDVRADLYSVGVLLYTALAKRSPFQSKAAVGVFQEQLEKDPPPLHTVVKGLPPKLSEFVQALLSRDPQSRPASPRAALLALAEAAEHAFPFDRLQWPPPFSDPDDVFLYPDYLKLFRRIALQGGRWAITGESGSGKTFLARWLQRLFWLNQKHVVSVCGRDIALLQGDQLLHPSEPTYLLIDDADQGPTEAWLRARPYQHIVAFGSRMQWAKKEGRWKPYELKPLENEQVGAFLKKDLMNIDPRVLQEWMTRTQGHLQNIVQHGRALGRQGMIQRLGATYLLNTEKYLKASASLQSEHAGSPFSGYLDVQKKILVCLNFVRVPLKLAALSRWLGVAPEEMSEALPALLRDEAVERRVWRGQEYFQSSLSGDAMQAPLDEVEVKRWIEGLWEESWYRDALAAFDGYFGPEALQDPGLVLLKAKLLSAAGQHAEILGLITAPFVNTLDAEGKSQAFETLGQALLFTGKAKQADAAFRNALKHYQQSQNHEGQARVLMDLGILFDKAGEAAKAAEFFNQAYQAAALAPQATLLKAMIDLQVANLYATATDFDQAEQHFQSCLQALEALRKDDLIAQAYYAYAAVSLNVGDSERVEYYAREGLGIAMFIRDLLTQGRFFLLLAKLEERNNNTGGVLEKLSSAVQTLAQAPLHGVYLQALVERAYFYETHRQLLLAKQDAEEALTKAKRIKDPDYEARAHLVLGKMLRRDMDRLEGALEHLELARAHFRATHNFLMGWECEYERGEIERQRNNREAALAHFDQALQMLETALVQVPAGSPEAGILMQKKMMVEMTKGNV